jgi:hypothetical protein
MGTTASATPHHDGPEALVCPPPTSTLYDLVLDLNWPQVEDHVAKHPQDAEWFDWDCRETPLYLALQVGLPPPSTVRALIQANPSSVVTPQTKNKNWPIHIVCRFGNQLYKKELIELLLQSQKKDDNDNDNFDSRQVSIIQQATARTKYGKTPLSALCDSVSLDGNTDLNLRSKKDFQHHWECIQLLLAAASGLYQHSAYLEPETMEFMIVDSENDNQWEGSENEQATATTTKITRFLPIQGALQLSQDHECPLDVFRLALKVCPSVHISLRDGEGRLPLHLALSNAMQGKGFKSSRDCEWVVSQLLARYSSAASVRDPVTGMHPLHTAVQIRPPVQREESKSKAVNNGTGRRMFVATGPSCHVSRLPWEGVLMDLFHAFPEAAGVANDRTGLLPFMEAAVMEHDERAFALQKNAARHFKELDQVLDNVYELLRVRPDVLKDWTRDGDKYVCLVDAGLRGVQSTQQTDALENFDNNKTPVQN